ncbi:copper homeostasis CutC domain-containing protein [Lentinula aff. detonsa]|uniref:Copper homeostasis protein cutC homolog n=1 Tax=Lentinula aff. detonsa TaxID=2804958 RepID=A0AA38KQZ1_9AGAR|nr:copper homeostasis CutC domain-containing protein [Lentinula aff. detonsa]
MAHSILIEVCIDSVESAMSAIRGGANRLEVCGNLAMGGGTTPSLGLLKAVREAVESFQVPIMVMIRPRTGDFLYSESEMQIMIEDIRIFNENGVEGFVFGVLTEEGRVDVARTKRLVEASFPARVCFHRAFDMTRDPMEAMIDIMRIGGISHILTSGQGKSASQSLEILASLLKATRNSQDQSSSLTIMPGSGINPNTVGHVVNTLLPLGLSEIHLSGGSWMEGGMSFRREGMGMGVGGKGNWGIWRTDEGVVREVKAQVEAMKME